MMIYGLKFSYIKIPLPFKNNLSPEEAPYNEVRNVDKNYILVERLFKFHSLILPLYGILLYLTKTVSF